MLKVATKFNLLVVNCSRCPFASCFNRSYYTKCDFAIQKRTTYPRMYKSSLYLEDGSSVTVRLEVPRKFIQLPLDLSLMNEDERRKTWLSRKGKVETEDLDLKTVDEYDGSKYKKFWK